MKPLHEVPAQNRLKLKQSFNEVESLGIIPYLSDWLEDDAEIFLSPIYDTSQGYASYMYDWETNGEGFSITDQEHFDHIAITNEGKPLIVTIDDQDKFRWYEVQE